MTQRVRDIVVIGASAGGIVALKRLVQMLPSDLNASIFIVLHRSDLLAQTERDGRDTLAEVLSKGVSLPVTSPDDGERFKRGHVYVAPSACHLLIEGGLVRLERSPRESSFRPSADALFRSAALEYGRRVIGVVLSGLLTDGTAGLWQIRKRGGVAIAQDPAEAEFSDMVKSAINNVAIDFCLCAKDIGKKIVELCTPAKASESSRAKVLIVEDERIVAMNLKSRLTKLGYESACHRPAQPRNVPRRVTASAGPRGKLDAHASPPAAIAPPTSLRVARPKLAPVSIRASTPRHGKPDPVVADTNEVASFVSAHGQVNRSGPVCRKCMFQRIRNQFVGDQRQGNGAPDIHSQFAQFQDETHTPFCLMEQRQVLTQAFEKLAHIDALQVRCTL